MKKRTQALLIFVFTLSQIYCAMGKLDNVHSSALLSFFEEALGMSIFTVIAYIPIAYLLRKIQSQNLKMLARFSFFVVIWFYLDYCIFEYQVAMWSTFTFYEMLYQTLSYSWLAILILASVLTYIFKRMEK
ncbi:hypothetical protein [Phocoenobacter skyensis]|uniref:Uncharacterized protein n=1 Tax=Phocoenobacter skyensis TaxID=97481 RepID=A0A1H7Y6T4_9PAST|nr:hypothetical protein [Pasteurella skyensis]MDP8079948.1 hypothetical protein [Pasteurella skyensis]MDP8085844.1 hypothetical protein [Pasteurella skyensis]MDP8185712.1 hypothetical protein [Pasteurella skyensis]QLB22334.1 hypothetical protein A6B44_03605 [Pasteurella skyensis]SEM41047.1 hypothetical protein SAMN05444853_11634 [Pasteurella skyensis]